MLKQRLYQIVLIVFVFSLMAFVWTVSAEVDSETCVTTVQPEATTDSESVEYTISGTEVISSSLTGTTISYSISYTLDGSATVEDYGMVYAAARVYLREDSTYEWSDIQDLMEVGTIIQQCGETDGDFTSVQLLSDSVSLQNDEVPDLSEQGEIDWMYTTFFEAIEFEVSTSVSRTVSYTETIEYTYDPAIELWYDSVSGTINYVYETDEFGDLVLDLNGNPIPGVEDSLGNFVALGDIVVEPEGATLTFDPPVESWTYDVDLLGNVTLLTDPTISVEYTPDGSDAEEGIRDAIAEDIEGYEFDPYEVADEEAVGELETWFDNLYDYDNADFDDERAMYLNEDGELIDDTSEDFGGEEEGPLQYTAENNGQFDEGRTNEFDCAGQGNSCNNKSENAQNNGYVGDVNKFGCIGRGNSCNAGNPNDAPVEEAAEDADLNKHGCEGRGNSCNAPGRNKGD